MLFRQALRRAHVAQKRPPTRIVRTLADAKRLNLELLQQPLVALDTEWYNYDRELGTPVNNGLAACLTMCWRDQPKPHEKVGQLHIVYVHNAGKSSENIYALRSWLESERHEKILHNAPVDAHIVQNHGIRPGGFKSDTMVLDWLVDENRENRHNLKECTEDHLGRPRVSYNQTFGAPKLRKDGQPYASGQLIVPTMEEILQQIDDGDDDLFDKLVEYSSNDSWDTWDLYWFYKPQLEAVPWVNGKTIWDYFQLNARHVTGLIQRMERRGMFLDLDFMSIMAERCANDLQHYEAEVLEWAGCPMKITSRPQLAHLIYGKGLKEIRKTPKAKKVLFTIKGKGYPNPFKRYTDGGAPSTKAEHLVELRKWLEKQGYDPEELTGFDAILKYQKYEKQRNTYLVGLAEKARKSRVHGRVNQIGTTSGRFSSSEPNLQNITTGDKDIYNIRDCFSAPPGYTLIVADFSQLEYRLLAHFSQEPKLIKLFYEGWDLHSLTCFNIFVHVKKEVLERFGEFTIEASKWIAEEYPDERKKAKTLNFEIIYGVGPGKLADQLRITFDEAKAMIEGWFRGYPYVTAWMERVKNEARVKGYGRTLWGRYRKPDMSRLLHDCQPGCPKRRMIDGEWRRCGQKGEEERTFVNALIQGSAADMAQRAMINIDNCKELHDLGVYMVMQVHDELIFECPKHNVKRAIELIRPLMEMPFGKPLRVPMPVSIGKGPTWASAKV